MRNILLSSSLFIPRSCPKDSEIASSPLSLHRTSRLTFYYTAAMSATTTTTNTVALDATPQYEYYYRDNHVDNKREVVRGERAVETFSEIPLVDLSGIFSENIVDRKATAQEISEVCKRVGFMYIKNHGIDQALIDEVFALSREYHAQPSEVKMKEYVYKNEALRGYDEHFSSTPDGLVCT